MHVVGFVNEVVLNLYVARVLQLYGYGVLRKEYVVPYDDVTVWRLGRLCGFGACQYARGVVAVVGAAVVDVVVLDYNVVHRSCLAPAYFAAQFDRGTHAVCHGVASDVCVGRLD